MCLGELIGVMGGGGGRVCVCEAELIGLYGAGPSL